MTTDAGRGGRAPRRRSGTVAPASRAMTAGISLAATASIVAALALSAQSSATGGPSTVELDVTSGTRAGSDPIVDTGPAVSVEQSSAPSGSVAATVGPAKTGGTSTAAPSPTSPASAPVTSAPVAVAPAPSANPTPSPPPTSPPVTTTPTTARPTTTTTAPRTRAS